MGYQIRMGHIGHDHGSGPMTDGPRARNVCKRVFCFLTLYGHIKAAEHYTAIRLMVHWPLMGGLLHLVRRGGAWAGWGFAQSPPHCTKCNRLHII